MNTFELTALQANDLLTHNYTYHDVPSDCVVYRGDTVQCIDRLCHVRSVTENRHAQTKRVVIVMGAGR